jgi:AmmeMemoRadiSam system protein B
MRIFLIIGLIFMSWSPGLCGQSSPSSSNEAAEVRSSPLAGAWYPAEPETLKEMLHDYLERARVPEIEGRILALVSPHAGYRYSGQGAAYGFKTLVGKDFERVILIGPSHYARFRGIAVSSYDCYETPLGRVPVDKGIGNKLSQHSLFVAQPFAEEQEHALEMEIPYLQTVLKDFQIVPLLVGALEETDYPEVVRLLHPFITDKTLVVVSSDFTHFGNRFGYLPFRDHVKDNLKKLDMGAVDHILNKDFDGYVEYLRETGITICGRLPIALLLRLLPPEAEGMLLDYSTSGDLLNDYSSSVSYVSLIFRNPATKQDRQNAGSISP